MGNYPGSSIRFRQTIHIATVSTVTIKKKKKKCRVLHACIATIITYDFISVNTVYSLKLNVYIHYVLYSRQYKLYTNIFTKGWVRRCMYTSVPTVADKMYSTYSQ